jgi:predicted MFS family arabinose efflux permease
MVRVHDAWDAALLIAVILAVPAGIFHYMGGRYGQVIIAIVAVSAGIWILTHLPQIAPERPVNDSAEF